mmetsp:Transcript_23120/g.34136  ORF Transcript_23120/g.34136 Transcript_23120/m.34136 type:complete len:366 (-) Transcript_23120:1800-2897(-)
MVRIKKASGHHSPHDHSPKSAINSTFLTFSLFLVILYSSYVILSRSPSNHFDNSHSQMDSTMSHYSNIDGGIAGNPLKTLGSKKKPYLIYGTAWKKEDTAHFVSEAIKAGFRFIDTACQPKHYNEAGVGDGWISAAEEIGLSRKDLFLQTKFTAVDGQDLNNMPYNPLDPIEDQVRTSLEVSLKNLRTDYIDRLVMHSPLKTMDDTMRVWRVMERFVDEKKVLYLGISNCYDYNKFTTLFNQARIKPTALQNRFYSQSNFDTKLRDFCKQHDIWYQSFWTLSANRKALTKPKVMKLAQSKGLTPQTYMFAFLLSLGYATPLSGTTSNFHMVEDVAVMTRIQEGESIFESEEELKNMADALGMPNL